MTPSDRPLSRVFTTAWLALAAGALLMLAGVTGGCAPAAPSPPATVARAVAQTSASCRECHADVHAAWHGTDHARANRPVDPVRDAEALGRFAAAAPGTPGPDMVLGNLPLWQPLIPAPGGRWQPHEQAFDPARREFFHVFGDENRRPGEWGHWTGRGMNWNSMCAHCHMTGYQRGYAVATDTYRSTWVEHGVGCIPCHGPMPANHGRPGVTSPVPAPPFLGDRARIMQTCVPCHARNEPLTDTFQPGDNYFDHYRVVLPVEPGLFYPDGQQRDEVFNWTSVLLSRMGHAGVSCLDCHDPHTNKPILPVADNQLCQQCHAPPGRQLAGGARALPIDPIAHSGHAAGSAGASCVACHMPTTPYMQRAPRHDHGWLSPDPLMTRELGIPNACSTCHADRGLDWAIAKTDELFGSRVRERQRERARALSAAQNDAPGAAAQLLALLAREDIPAWRATYLTLLRRVTDGGRGTEAARAALGAAHPLERSAAVQFLDGHPQADTLLRPLLADPVRLVRLDAAWALSPTLAADAPARRELDTYLDLGLDQPAGRARRAQDLANRGQHDAALGELDVAVRWDPHSPGLPETRASILVAQGDLAGAGNSFYRAAMLATGPAAGPLAFNAALAFAEAGRREEAENALRLAVQRDPALHRAWYNLGLLLAGAGRTDEGLSALGEARRLAPADPDYLYAAAATLWRAGQRDEARKLAEEGLTLAPADPRFRELLRATR